MVAPAVDGIDLFKIAGQLHFGVDSQLQNRTASHVRQPFCSQLEEQLLLSWNIIPRWPGTLVAILAPPLLPPTDSPPPSTRRSPLATRLRASPMTTCPMPLGSFTNGRLFIAEAGMEDDKRGDRNLAKAEAARSLARIQRGVFWIGTEATLTKTAPRQSGLFTCPTQTFPAFPRSCGVAGRLAWGEVACVAGGGRAVWETVATSWWKRPSGSWCGERGAGTSPGGSRAAHA